MNRFAILILALVSPYLLSFIQVAPDSSYTEVGVAVGTGSYAEVTRDCSGKVTSVKDVPFQEAAISVDHYSHVVHFGLRAGMVGGEAGRRFLPNAVAGITLPRIPRKRDHSTT